MIRKPPALSRLPLQPMAQIAQAYGDRGLAMQRRSYTSVCDEILAHVHAFADGEEFNTESNHHHLAEAGAAIAQLLQCVFTESGVDDRPDPVRVNVEEVARELGFARTGIPELTAPRGPEDEG